ncbi:O-antigen ligase family protein [Candidatus Omnitrophota bacterium]
MGVTGLNKSRIADWCDKIIEIFLYVLIFCLPFSKAMIEIAASFIIFAWLVKRITIKNFRPVSTYLNIPITAYILATFLSVIFSSDFSLSLKNFGTKMMEYMTLYFIVAETIADRRRLKNICIVMLVSAAMIGVDCILQYILGFDFLRCRPQEAGRVTGSFQMPGSLAAFLGPVLCLSLSLCFLKLKKGIKYFLSLEAVLLITLLVVSLTRGAWLGFAVAVCFLGVLENKKIIYLTVAFLLILGIIVPYLIETPENIFAHLKSVFSLTSNLDRKTIWQAAMQMIKDRPLFGHGYTTFMGNFAKYGQDYHYFKIEGIIPYAHNCYLQIAAETGIVGLVSFLSVIGTFLVHSIVSLTKIKDRFHHAVLSGISAGIIVTLVHSAVDTNLYSLPLAVLFWFMLGINAALQRNVAFGKANS